MKLDENYTLKGEPYKWELIYKEETDEISEKTGKKIVKNEKWYYPKVKMALEKYVEEALKPQPSVEKILKKQEEILETIERLKFNK